MNSFLYKIEDLNLIYHPKALFEWLDKNVGAIHHAMAWLFDGDVPAKGDNWRIVKLYQRIGDGKYQFSFFIEFENSTDFIHFKLAWN
jgi:hypothetical protein